MYRQTNRQIYRDRYADRFINKRAGGGGGGHKQASLPNRNCLTDRQTDSWAQFDEARSTSPANRPTSTSAVGSAC